MKTADYNLGTCSWKYDSWRGLIYPEDGAINYLQEYSHHYNCVEVDQWFWSLFPGNKIVLPKVEVIEEYRRSVPESFSFGIKVPNSITLTHHYKKEKSSPLVTNDHFLSYELMMRFLDLVAPLVAGKGVLMLQFEYLNKLKMPGGVGQFTDKLSQFMDKLPHEFTLCIEPRNPNFLGQSYFKSLQSMGGHHVFLHGYYMPSIFDLYKKFHHLLDELTVIRMHGPDRKDIERLTGKNWNEIVAPKDQDVTDLASMLMELRSREMKTFTFINNHFEGSAPKTIQRLNRQLQEI